MAKRYGELVQDLWNGHFKSITPLKFRVSYIFPTNFTNCERIFRENCILLLARRGCLANCCIHDNYVFTKIRIICENVYCMLETVISCNNDFQCIFALDGILGVASSNSQSGNCAHMIFI